MTSSKHTAQQAQQARNEAEWSLDGVFGSRKRLFIFMALGSVALTLAPVASAVGIA